MYKGIVDSSTPGYSDPTHILGSSSWPNNEFFDSAWGRTAPNILHLAAVYLWQQLNLKPKNCHHLCAE